MELSVNTRDVDDVKIHWSKHIEANCNPTLQVYFLQQRTASDCV